MLYVALFVLLFLWWRKVLSMLTWPCLTFHQLYPFPIEIILYCCLCTAYEIHVGHAIYQPGLIDQT